MKATKRLATLAAIAALTVGTATSVRADDQQPKSKVGAETQVDINRDKDASRRYTASENRSERKTGVSDVHKASSIVGMKVKNQADETLGTIEDLVVDLKTGKISYAVLGVGGFLGVGEKYIAVPPSAFNVGSDEKTLILNADKAKLQAAEGFVKTNWPDYQNPSFAEGFWDNANVGGSAGVTTGSEKSSSSSDLNRERKNDLNRERKSDSKSTSPRPNP